MEPLVKTRLVKNSHKFSSALIEYSPLEYFLSYFVCFCTIENEQKLSVSDVIVGQKGRWKATILRAGLQFYSLSLRKIHVWAKIIFQDLYTTGVVYFNQLLGAGQNMKKL